MKTFKNGTSRAAWWNYNSNGKYFITINTANRTHLFGEIINHKMVLSDYGKIAEAVWLNIPQQFDYALIDEFVFMPNHMHGIIIIDKEKALPYLKKEPKKNKIMNGGVTGQNNPMLNENLSRVVRWFKGRTTFECRKLEDDFAWQPKYFEEILFTEKHYFNVKNYIRLNPLNWDEEAF